MSISVHVTDYADFKSLIGSFPAKGEVYYSGSFSALFISSEANRAVTLSLAAAPASFATDFPAAISASISGSVTASGARFSASSYVDFMAVIGSLPVNRLGQLYYFDDTAVGNYFSAAFVSEEGNYTVGFAKGSITSPPASFATDWPTAIQVNTDVPNALVLI